MSDTKIIIPTFNLSWMTCNLLASILWTCDEKDFDLIIMDNGSRMEEYEVVKKYLKDNFKKQTHLIYHTDEQLGFVRAVNQAMQIAWNNKAENIVILNNDTIVTGAWLTNMVETLNAQYMTGIVGCTSSPPNWRELPNPAQMIEQKMRYSLFRQYMETYAKGIWEAFQGEVMDVDFHPFFCVAFKIAMLEDVGFLDEDYGLGLFDDDDYCYRAQQKGWKIKLRKDTYVHHYHRSSWIEHSIEYMKLLEENRAIFIKKHGHDPWDRVRVK